MKCKNIEDGCPWLGELRGYEVLDLSTLIIDQPTPPNITLYFNHENDKDVKPIVKL